MKRSPAEQTIRKLIELAQQLRQGADFSITRLTIIKRLCADSTAAGHFALFIAQRTSERMLQRATPEHLAPEQWAHYQHLVANAMPQMVQCVTAPANHEKRTMFDLLHALEQEQNQYKNIQWGPVRIIQSKELVTIETALRCIVGSHDTAYWCYQLARDYAERYDPHYGTGLIPESASFVEDIAAFWCGYYYHQSLTEWSQRMSKTPARRRAEDTTQE